MSREVTCPENTILLQTIDVKVTKSVTMNIFEKKYL